MTLTELEVAIGDFFKELYKAEYVGKMKLEVLPIGGYKLTLALNNVERPVIFSYEGDEKKFLKFVREELRSRHWGDMHYYMGYKSYRTKKNDCE